MNPLPTTVPRGQPRESLRTIIGRNIRPGTKPGGFSTGFGKLTTSVPKLQTRTREPRSRRHEEIIEAANDVLLGRTPAATLEP